MNYPKWLYHRTESPVLVNNPDEQEALGKSWKESPSECTDALEAAPVTVTPQVTKGKKNASR